MYNTEQQIVVDHIYGSAVVLAGAGSGKTTTLTGRLESLVSVGIDPLNIVLVTFTRTAAEVMKIRASAVDERCKDIVASTYHKYFSEILRKYGKHIGLSPYYEVVSGSKYNNIIDYVKNNNDKYDEENLPTTATLSKLFGLISNEMFTELNANKYYRANAKAIDDLYKDVRSYSKLQNKLCFDDILLYTRDLLDHEDICELIAKNKFFMVDEFQDTNKVQLDILCQLGRFTDNIMVVGDVSQSIYKFRGARVENIQSFIDFFHCPTYTLSINYRSTQEILDAVNVMMNKNVSSWSYVNMQSNGMFGKKPYFIQHYNDQSQAEWLVRAVKHFVNNEKYDYSQIAIIERQSASSFRLERLLSLNHINFIKVGGLKFTDYIVVSDLLAFLVVATKTHTDKFNWYNILKLIPGIGEKISVKIAEDCDNDDFLLNYEKKKYGPKLKELHENIAGYRAMYKAMKSVSAVLQELSTYYFSLRKETIKNSKMSESAKDEALTKLKSDKEIAKVLIEMAEDYKGVTTFVDDIMLNATIDSSETEDEDKLTITTIHGAKGLEYDIVFIIDSIESVDSQDRYAEDNDDFEEELRCMYVAMTRAKKYLYISCPKFTSQKGITVPSKYIMSILSESKYIQRIVE